LIVELVHVFKVVFPSVVTIFRVVPLFKLKSNVVPVGTSEVHGVVVVLQRLTAAEAVSLAANAIRIVTATVARPSILRCFMNSSFVSAADESGAHRYLLMT